ncbi:MAG: 6-pyruvoyl trahydropterin synthase family protein [Zoogloea sp.]|uniref:6-pyruvoyl trahydropterin synthase family protein n=1 Tax=Zoogloea sp. TaxID=49181 RepID=UPI003F34DB6B
MLIRKLFKFESAHIVRQCSTRRCSHSIHGHSCRVELLLEADQLDRGQMVYDFGLLKYGPRLLVDAFDHSITLWAGDDPEYLAAAQGFSERHILLPVSPSAEQLSRVFFVLLDQLLRNTPMHNGESGVRLHSVIVHETDTGYAQCFRQDADNPAMGRLSPAEILFSPAIQADWAGPEGALLRQVLGLDIPDVSRADA